MLWVGSTVHTTSLHVVSSIISAPISIPISRVKLLLLPGYWLLTFCLLPGYFLVTTLLLPGYCLVTTCL